MYNIQAFMNIWKRLQSDDTSVARKIYVNSLHVDSEMIKYYIFICDLTYAVLNNHAIYCSRSKLMAPEKRVG